MHSYIFSNLFQKWCKKTFCSDSQTAAWNYKAGFRLNLSQLARSVLAEFPPVAADAAAAYK